MDLSRTRFGVGLSVTAGPVDLEPLCRHVLEELRRVYPDCVLRFDALGDLRGDWDGDRVAQLTSYLVRDAIQQAAVSRSGSWRAETLGRSRSRSTTMGLFLRTLWEESSSPSRWPLRTIRMRAPRGMASDSISFSKSQLRTVAVSRFARRARREPRSVFACPATGRRSHLSGLLVLLRLAFGHPLRVFPPIAGVPVRRPSYPLSARPRRSRRRR